MMSYLRFWKNYHKQKIKAGIKASRVPAVKHTYSQFGILNPSIATSNIGDVIIYQSVIAALRKIDNEAMFSEFPTQLHCSYDALSLMSEKDALFVAGTNLLSSNLEDRYQWKVHSGFKKYIPNKVVLVGCGWWQYQDDVNAYTRSIYQSLLNDKILHSVRDEYTAAKLKASGISNVVNTSCPTLWGLTPGRCAEIPVHRAENVITTLTFYNKDQKNDSFLLDILRKKYQKVYLWVQGMADLAYLEQLGCGDNIEIIPPTLDAYDEVLSKGGVDYVGTRLHAGVRALQHRMRTQIIAVDNRALEIGRDVNLNVISRDEVEKINLFIDRDYQTDIRVPVENIQMWFDSVGQALQ